MKINQHENNFFNINKYLKKINNIKILSLQISIMKKYVSAMVASLALLIISNSADAQNKKYVPEKGFWVLESNIHQKKNTIVRFYDDRSNLIYEETAMDVRMNIKRKKTLMFLKTGLEKALIAWNQNNEAVKNGDIIALLIHNKK